MPHTKPLRSGHTHTTTDAQRDTGYKLLLLIATLAAFSLLAWPWVTIFTERHIPFWAVGTWLLIAVVCGTLAAADTRNRRATARNEEEG